MALTLTFQGHSRSNVMVVFDSHIYGFLLMFNSNIGAQTGSLYDTNLQNQNDL